MRRDYPSCRYHRQQQGDRRSHRLLTNPSVYTCVEGIVLLESELATGYFLPDPIQVYPTQVAAWCHDNASVFDQQNYSTPGPVGRPIWMVTVGK